MLICRKLLKPFDCMEIGVASRDPALLAMSGLDQREGGRMRASVAVSRDGGNLFECARRSEFRVWGHLSVRDASIPAYCVIWTLLAMRNG